MNWSPPTLADVPASQGLDRPLPTHARRLNARRSMRRLGCRAHLKCENLNPTGAFKVRGGINLLSTLDEEQKARGVLAASTGNHAQSVAYARSFRNQGGDLHARGGKPDEGGRDPRLRGRGRAPRA